MRAIHTFDYHEATYQPQCRLAKLLQAGCRAPEYFNGCRTRNLANCTRTESSISEKTTSQFIEHCYFRPQPMWTPRKSVSTRSLCTKRRKGAFAQLVREMKVSYAS